jgi:NarL family two-component system response regulator LiaR
MLSDGNSGISVLIADDHELVRRGLRAVLELEPDITVVGEAATGRQAVDAACRTKPDVILLDLRMPEMDGVVACRELRERCPDTRIVVLTAFDEDDEVFGVLSAGASSYVLKDISPEALVQTVRGVAAGRTILDASVAGRVIEGRQPGAAEPAADQLSRREVEVLELMAQGLRNKEIAKGLWISEPTVKTHVSHIIQKLGQTDRTQAVLHAIRKGLVRVKPD